MTESKREGLNARQLRMHSGTAIFINNLISGYGCNVLLPRKEKVSFVKYTRNYTDPTFAIRCWSKRPCYSDIFALPSDEMSNSQSLKALRANTTLLNIISLRISWFSSLRLDLLNNGGQISSVLSLGPLATMPTQLWLLIILPSGSRSNRWEV